MLFYFENVLSSVRTAILFYFIAFLNKMFKFHVDDSMHFYFICLLFNLFEPFNT